LSVCFFGYALKKTTITLNVLAPDKFIHRLCHLGLLPKPTLIWSQPDRAICSIWNTLVVFCRAVLDPLSLSNFRGIANVSWLAFAPGGAVICRLVRKSYREHWHARARFCLD
jgi:hypothetical protein